MSNYVILQPIHLGSGHLGEARRKALEAIAAEAECFWGGQPSIGRWLIKLADERRSPMAYYCTGTNGSVLQLEDGRYADTVSGDTSEAMNAHKALEVLETIAENAEWQDAPLFGDFNQAAMEEYCGK